MTIITLEEYFGKWIDCPDATDIRMTNAKRLLNSVNSLLAYLGESVDLKRNPATHSLVSGQTLGGFRPQNCEQGAPHSAHKEGMAVDIYDPDGRIDLWCVKHQDALERLGLYLEHPEKTNGWCHLQIRRTASGARVFWP